MQTTCPNCGWSNTRFSVPDGVIDAVLRLMLLAPVRCRSCRHRFYRFSLRGFQSRTPDSEVEAGILAPLAEPRIIEHLAVREGSISSRTPGAKNAMRCQAVNYLA